ncbi:hypothetical protein CC79DRAFT_1182636 [Sarocladium strictum]
MFTYRGRGGPSRSTPANVTCQKCLKKGHYSYECKASSQERPYVSRPSRSQQLKNPKLVPELTNDKPDPLETKQGAADAELAKKEAERARKRELEQRDDELVDSVAKRRRSVSSDSVSTISTRSSRSPPPAKRDSASPPRRERRQSPEPRARTRSRSDVSRSLSRSVSPPRGQRPGPSRTQDATSRRSRRDRSYGSSVSRSRSPARGHSRSPGRDVGRREDRGGRPGPGRSDGGRGPSGRGGRLAARSPPRERSLSPFSRRLALTKSMK